MDSRFFDSGFVKSKQEGVYRVKPGRALVWQSDSGPQKWAGPGEYVRVDPTLSAYLQLSRQMPRIERVEEREVPDGAIIMTDASAPPALRNEMQKARGAAVQAEAAATPDDGPRVSKPAAAPPAPEPKPKPGVSDFKKARSKSNQGTEGE